MTKREVLIQVCENPGWEPPNQGNGTERHVDELSAEGWIQPGLDGFHATTRALEGYPYFVEQADIAEVVPEPEPPTDCVPVDRVVTLVVGMLREMPIGKVMAIAASPAFPLGPEWEVASEIVERMTSATAPRT